MQDSDTTKQVTVAEPRRFGFGKTAFGLTRFGLRRFLLIVTIVCVGFGWCYQRTTQNSRAVKFLASQEVHHRYCHPEIEAPNWQRKLLGDEYFLKIRVLGISGQQASSAAFWEELRKHQGALQNVELVQIWCEGKSVSDESTATLSLLSSLTAVSVLEGQVSSNWLIQCGSLEPLRSLRIETPCSPIDSQALAGLHQASVIVLDDCGLNLDDAEFLRDQLRSTMIVVVENNDSNVFN